MNVSDRKTPKLSFALLKKHRTPRLELTDEHLETWQRFMERLLESEPPPRKEAPAEKILLDG